jgi:hypothetical protein
MPRFLAGSHLIVGLGVYTLHVIDVEHDQVIQYIGIRT